MEILLSWMLKSLISSGILYYYYQVALRNKQFHVYNRFYLLGTVILSLIGPFINFKWFEIKTPENNPLNFFLNTADASPVSLSPAPNFTTIHIILSCAFLVSIALLILFFLKILWVFRVKATGETTIMKRFNFIETGVKQAPFSFLNNLFWKKNMSTTDSNGKKIFNHELAHIKQRHTYDKLFCQLVSCIFWMNPFYWLIQKELNVIHEFLADQKCIEQGDTESFAMMLLHAHNNGSYLNPSHSFFNSSIKRRLVMITSSKNSQYYYVNKILVLPVGLLVLFVLSVSAKEQTDPMLYPGPVNVNKVIIQKKSSAQNPADSTVDVHRNYVITDGSPATLILDNVKYKAGIRNTSEKKHPKQEVGSGANQQDLFQKQHDEKLAAEKETLK